MLYQLSYGTDFLSALSYLKLSYLYYLKTHYVIKGISRHLCNSTHVISVSTTTTRGKFPDYR